MAIIRKQVVVCSTKYLICLIYCFVPLLACVLIVVQDEVFEGGSKSQLSRVHGSHSNKIVDDAIRFADASMADTRHTAGKAGQGSPNKTVGVSIVLGVNFHLDFVIFFHADNIGLYIFLVKWIQNNRKNKGGNFNFGMKVRNYPFFVFHSFFLP